MWRAAKAWRACVRRATSAVSASLRLPCGARAPGPRPNSLRSLRSLRSDTGRESVHEARCARGQKPCAPRRLPRTPAAAPPRLCRDSGGGQPPNTASVASRQAVCGGGSLWGGEERRAWGRRAQRAATSDSLNVSERSERSERSEFGRESDDEARCARGQKPCAPRRLPRTPAAAPPRLCRDSGGSRQATAADPAPPVRWRCPLEGERRRRFGGGRYPSYFNTTRS